MAVPIQNCCVVFNLRQGTVIIAVIELFLSAVALVLLAMGLSHAQYAASLLAADMEESAIHEEETTALLYAASSDGFPGPPHYYNEEHLLRAQQLGTVMIIAMYTGMALAAIKLVSCILLLYGALMRARHYLLPWVSIVLIEMVFTFSAIVACLAFGSFRHFTIGLFACGVVQLMLAFYLWLAVFSFYRQLYEDEVINGSVREVTTANAMKTGYLQFSGKPYNV